MDKGTIQADTTPENIRHGEATPALQRIRQFMGVNGAEVA